MKFLRFSVIILLGLFLINCRKTRNNNEQIPFYPVNFIITVADPQFNKLNVPGGWVYVTGGSMGIIIYRKSNEEFMAYDRHCPYKVTDNCRVEVEQNQVSVTDSCCGSRFILTDGSVIKGPAAGNLQFYRTSFDGNRLQVFN